jgi:hypothetical protein
MIFGDKETFAINYRPQDLDYVNEPYIWPHIHLILGGKFIGNPDEACMLGTWCGFKNQVEKIKKNQGNLRHSAFEGLSDEEIFELIDKTNQLEEEFKPEFMYLPQLSTKLWYLHRITIDETIDGYYIMVIEENNQLKFMWISNGWYEPQGEVGKLYTALVDYDEFFKTNSDFFAFLQNTYPGYLKD